MRPASPQLPMAIMVCGLFYSHDINSNAMFIQPMYVKGRNPTSGNPWIWRIRQVLRAHLLRHAHSAGGAPGSALARFWVLVGPPGAADPNAAAVLGRDNGTVPGGDPPLIIDLTGW